MAFKPIQIKCKSCGADLQLDPTLRISSCSYCGSTITITKDEVPGNWPDVDFIYEDKISESEQSNIIAKYFTESVYVPDELLDAHEKIKNYLNYLPFYIYSVEWTASWSADAGYNMKRQKWDASQKRNVTENYVEWKPVSGNAEGIWGGYAPGASIVQDNNFSQKLIPLAESLDSSISAEFDPQLLEVTSWLSFDSKPDDSYNKLVASRVETHIHGKCSSQVPGDKSRNLSVTSRKNYTYKRGIIPFWIFNYKFKDKNYLTVIDAVKGGLQGERPVSSRRILIACLYFILPFILFGSLFWIKNNSLNSINGYLVFLSFVVGGVLTLIYHSTLSSFKKDFLQISSEDRANKMDKMKIFEKKYLLTTIISLLILSIMIVFVF